MKLTGTPTVHHGGGLGGGGAGAVHPNPSPEAVFGKLAEEWPPGPELGEHRHGATRRATLRREGGQERLVNSGATQDLLDAPGRHKHHES